MATGGIRRMDVWTGSAQIDGNPRKSGSGLKPQPLHVVFIFHVTTPDNMIFDEPTKESYEVLQKSMQRYCSVYPFVTRQVVDVHQGSVAKKFAEYFDLVLNGPLYITCG